MNQDTTPKSEIKVAAQPGYNKTMPLQTGMQPPEKLPEPGFYYHYKHDPAKPLNHYAYEVLGAGCHTEADWQSPEAYMVIYRPLYEDSPAYKNGTLYFLRPAVMFMEDVMKDGQPVPRFHKILNPEIIRELESTRHDMYESGLREA